MIENFTHYSTSTVNWKALQSKGSQSIGWLALLGCLLGAAHSGFAQGSVPSSVPTIIPPAPTAAALEKYGQVPVSTYTGVPNIAVPLYEIKVRDLSIPLSLSYHAGGFRVSDEASWVGLGWSLQAGGVLTHTTRNLDDLTWFIPRSGSSRYGMPDCTPQNDIVHTTTGSGVPAFAGDPYSGALTIMLAGGGAFTGPDIKTYVQGVGLPYAFDGIYENTQIDWEPDDYRFTMGNYSGAFAFDQQGTIHLLDPQQRVRVSYGYGANGRVFWTLNTPDGFHYEFAAAEVSSTSSPDQLRNSSISAWYLTRIVSPLGEEATLTYQQGGNVSNLPGYVRTEIKQQQAIDGQPAAPISSVYSAGGTVPQYLQRIDFKTGYVLFERDECLRKDLQGGQRLKRVAIYTKDNQLLKAYELQTSYFETPSSLAGGYLTDASSSTSAFDTAKVYEVKRLRLDAVVESGQNNLRKPPIKLAYNATSLPAKSSYSVDYWGFNNGRNNNTLIPRYAGNDLSNNYVIYQGADRTPADGPMQACILQSITHPTSGKTAFAFEPHEYGNLTEEDDQLIEGGVSLRLQVDNLYPSSNYATSTIIRVKAPTPLTLDYTLGVETGGDLEGKKARTTLQLIDSTTNRPFTSGSPSLGNYVYAQWGFSSTTSNPSNPYNIPNWSQVTGHVVVLVPAGSYTLTGYTPTCSSSTAACHATTAATGSYPVIQRIQNTTIHKLLAGGLRIKRIDLIDNLDPARNQVQVFNYNSPGTSTSGQAYEAGNGVLLNRPIFSSVLKYYYAGEERFRHQLTSYSQVALSAGAKGSSVGYTQVSVLQGAQAEGGKTVYTYYCQPDRRVAYIDRQANVPSRADELNGSLLTQTTYRRDATGFRRLSQTANAYESVLDTRYHYDVPAVFKGEHFFTYSNTPNGNNTTGQRLYFYPIPVNWVRLVSTVQQQYDPQNEAKFLTTATRYTYDTLNVGHMQVSQTRTRRSDGNTVLTLTTYPADYSGVTSGPLVAMRGADSYQPNTVVETSTRFYGPTESAANARTIAGSYTEYGQPNSAAKYVPLTQQALELTQPTAAFSTAAPNLPPAGRYVPKVQLDYDPASTNLQQAQRSRDVATTYVWGYQNTLPLASVQNATTSQVQNALAALGTSLTALVTVTDEQQLRTTFTQLRQKLPQARITSFTYQPLVGITTQTQPDGRLLRYEYDGLQRLLRVRDEQGRILTQQEYKYAL